MTKCKKCGHDCHCDVASCVNGCICVECNCRKNQPLELKEKPVKNIWKRFLNWLFAWQK